MAKRPRFGGNRQLMTDGAGVCWGGKRSRIQSDAEGLAGEDTCAAGRFQRGRGCTAADFAVAAAAGDLVGLEARTMRHAFVSAGTRAAGLGEFLRRSAVLKQLHSAHGADDRESRKDGFTGTADILKASRGCYASVPPRIRWPMRSSM